MKYPLSDKQIAELEPALFALKHSVMNPISRVAVLAKDMEENTHPSAKRTKDAMNRAYDQLAKALDTIARVANSNRI